MNQKTIILTGILFALIVTGMFVYASLKSKEAQKETVLIRTSQTLS